MASKSNRSVASLVERVNAQPDWQEVAALEGMEVEIDTPVEYDVVEDSPMPEDRPAAEMQAVGAEGFVIVEDEDGIIVDFDPQPERLDVDESDFYRNLAEDLAHDDLMSIASELLHAYEENKQSRSEWAEQYKNGIEMLGFTYEERTQPFEGASGVHHPLLAEAAYQFQAQAYNELMPAAGPVRTVVLGESTNAKVQQAHRVKEYMNYYVTERMDEYDSELDQMLFQVPLAGSTFKKLWYDAALERVVSRFVPAEDLVVPFSASDLETCENVTQKLTMSINEVRKLQVMGFYSDVPVSATMPDPSDVQDAQNEAMGVSTPSMPGEETTLLECHVAYDIPGFEDVDADGEPTGIKLPYVITLCEDTMQVLSVRRNYDPQDPLKRKINYFTHYKFLPGFGFYGVGLVHAIGGLTRAATAALRQLIDAGTLANLPGGFKLRTLRVASDDEPIQPGEWRDVDAAGDSIRDALYPIPYKEPSQTLYALLGFVVEAGQRFAAITDLKVGDNNQQMAMGTVMALLEQGSRVMSAIHKRMHAAMRKEFKILQRLIRDHLAEDGYPYQVAGADAMIKIEDFSDSVNVLPVSDPNIFSSTQRLLIAQAQMEAAQAAPDLYKLDEVHRRYLEALGAKDINAVLRSRPQDTESPIDPAQENINALDQMELKAFEGQDHEAHVMAHMTFGASPLMAGMPAVAIALQKHILEHVRIQSEEEAVATFEGMGREADRDSPEFAATVAYLVAQNMTQLRELSNQISGEGEGPDPIVALKEAEIQQRAERDQQRAALDEQKLQVDAADRAERIRVAEERIRSQEQIAQARINAAIQREAMRNQQRGQ